MPRRKGKKKRGKKKGVGGGAPVHTTPSTADEFKALGNARFRAGKIEGAIEAYSSGIELEAENHTLWSNRSAAHMQLGQADEALADAQECVRLSPEWAKGRLRLGTALCRLERFPEAVATFSAAVELEPGNAHLLKMLTWARERALVARVNTMPDLVREKVGLMVPRRGPWVPCCWRDAVQMNPGVALRIARRTRNAQWRRRSSTACGVTPLMEACERGDLGEVQLRLRGGADANAATGGRTTPLFLASGEGNLGIVQALIAAGADVNAVGNPFDATPVFIASQNGHSEVVSTLMDAGAVVDVVDAHGMTPL
jgi:hypothetical protein